MENTIPQRASTRWDYAQDVAVCGGRVRHQSVQAAEAAGLKERLQYTGQVYRRNQQAVFSKWCISDLPTPGGSWRPSGLCGLEQNPATARSLLWCWPVLCQYRARYGGRTSEILRGFPSWSFPIAMNRPDRWRLAVWKPDCYTSICPVTIFPE